MSNEDFAKVAQNISVLYELSLSIGQSLDLKSNCDAFLKALMARKNFGFAAVWIKKTSMPVNLTEGLSMRYDEPSVQLVYAAPMSRVLKKVLPWKHPMFMAVETENFFTVDSRSSFFAQYITEKDVKKGAYAIFKLGKLGVLKLYSMAKTSPFDEVTLNQLKNVVAKFTVSIEGCLSHEQVISEMKQRKRVERELRASHQRFHTLLNSIEADVYVANMETYEILFMNDHMKTVFGKDFKGKICYEMFRRADQPCSHCTNSELLNKSGEPTGVCVWECQNPISRKWYMNYDRAIKWDDGSYVRLQIATDITTRKEAEKTLRKAHDHLENRVAERTAELVKSNTKLHVEIAERIRAEASARKAKEVAERASQAKSEFLANMSHELRTPLNHIIGFNELVLDQHYGKLNDVQEEYLKNVHTSSTHLLSLINDILDLSKVEAGKMELQLASVSLGTLLQESMNMIQDQAQKNRLTIQTRFENIPETIVADERKLKQILYNLLANAIKFSPEDSTIHFEAIPLDRFNNDQIKPSGDYIKIAVKDDGIGLKQDNLESIFSSFEQVEESMSRKYSGTGLGLSLTRSLVELHGGRIWAESDGENQGATFTFILPVEPLLNGDNEVAVALSPHTY